MIEIVSVEGNELENVGSGIEVTESKSFPIYFAKVDSNSSAKIPTKNDEDAGYDIYAYLPEGEDKIVIKPHETKLIPTGIASALPSNMYFQIEERGSTGSIGIKKSAGVIDSGYRGEWFIALYNTNDRPLYIIKEGVKDKILNLIGDYIVYYPYEKAIAQAVLHEVPSAIVNEISYEELQSMKSLRGTGSLGSSNK